MSNKALLTIVIVMLIGVFAIVLMQATEKPPSEKIADDVGEVTEEIGDELDDATDAR